MRRAFLLVIFLAGLILAEAAPGPLTANDVTLMFRAGYSMPAVLKDLSERHFTGGIDAAAEKQLLDAGATTALVDGLKIGAFNVPPAGSVAPKVAATQVRQSTGQMLQESELNTLRRAQMANAAAAQPAAPTRTEQQWLVDEIVRDIAEIILFAHEPATTAEQLRVETASESPGSSTFRVRVEAPGGKFEKTLELQHYLWSASSYSALAAEMLAIWPARAAETVAPDLALLNSLTTGDSTVIVRQSKRVSELLSRRPVDADLHEQAALIIGSLALREAAGDFADTRRLLSRMTTHLSLARAVRPAESDTGKLARIINLALAGRQQEAVDTIATLKPEHSRWATALRIRATGDWRLLANPAKATRLEQTETFRALRAAGADARALDFLKTIQAKPEADWCRMALERNLSVQEGHKFAGTSLPAGLVSLVEDWQAFAGAPPAESQITDILNRPAGRCLGRTIEGEAQLEVLSWGQFAAFHQRHLCQALVITSDFLRDKLGVPSEAKEMEEQTEKLFSGLTLYPVVRAKIANPGPRPPSAVLVSPELAALWRDHPDLVTAKLWAWNPAQRHLAEAWFQPAFPFGSVYEYGKRYDAFASAGLSRKGAAFADELAALAPYNLPVLRMQLYFRNAANSAAEETATGLASVKEFNILAMWDIADRVESDPPRYMKIMNEIAALEADHYIALGKYLVKRGLLPEAAQAYQKAFEQARDRVYVANNSEWLALYYFEHGRVDDAMKIATDAAESYSAGGLGAMARLLEKMQRFPEAEDYYKKIRTRYNDEAVLQAFYARNRDRSPEYARAVDAAVASMFPAGIEEVQLGSFQGPPTDGVLIKSPSELLHRHGMEPGDVIVAINGKRTRSQQQYTFLRDQDADQPMTLIVWKSGNYAQLSVNVPKRRMNCDIGTFAAR